jgi:hypothetical protein
MFPLSEVGGTAAGGAGFANLTGWVVLLGSILVTVIWLLYLYR